MPGSVAARRPAPSAFWPLQIGGWAVFGLALSLGRLGELPFARVVVIDWPFVVLGFLATLALHAAYSRLPMGAGSPARMLAASVAGSFGAAVPLTAAYHTFLASPAADRLGALLGAGPVGYGGPLLDNTVYHGSVLFAWSALYFGAQYYDALQAERERALRAEGQAHQAQLQMLAYQLNPHFLFNALNSIRTLIDEDRGRARLMVTELAGFLRFALEERPLHATPLADELAAIDAYLQIELIRFEERLDVAVHLGPMAAGCGIPAFLLHPLVENALKHGTPAATGEPLRVRLDARREGDRLVITVANTGALAAPETRVADVDAPGAPRRLLGGVGLRNVRARLAQLFPGRHRMELAERGGWVEATIEIPAIPASPSALTARVA